VSRKKQPNALRIDIMMNARMYPFRFFVVEFELFEGKVEVVGSESKRLSLSLLTSLNYVPTNSSAVLKTSP